MGSIEGQHRRPPVARGVCYAPQHGQREPANGLSRHSPLRGGGLGASPPATTAACAWVDRRRACARGAAARRRRRGNARAEPPPQPVPRGDGGPPLKGRRGDATCSRGGRVWLRWPHRVAAPGFASSRRWLRSVPTWSVAMRSKSWRSESPAGVLFASFALVSPSCATRRSWRRRCARVRPNLMRHAGSGSGSGRAGSFSMLGGF